MDPAPVLCVYVVIGTSVHKAGDDLKTSTHYALALTAEYAVVLLEKLRAAHPGVSFGIQRAGVFSFESEGK
jgi:hypothetical protein